MVGRRQGRTVVGRITHSSVGDVRRLWDTVEDEVYRLETVARVNQPLISQSARELGAEEKTSLSCPAIRRAKRRARNCGRHRAGELPADL